MAGYSPVPSGLSIPKEYYYFPLATTVGLPSQVLLELSGLDYKGEAIAMDKWATVKPTTPTGKLPYAIMADGTALAESGAIARCIAVATGRIGEGMDYAMSEQLAGLNADFQKAVMEISPTRFTIANFDPKKFAEKKPAALEFIAKYEPFLKEDRFTASGLTFGEIDLFCKLYCFQTPLPEIVTGKLAAFYKRIAEMPAVSKLLSGESRYGKLLPYMEPIPGLLGCSLPKQFSYFPLVTTVGLPSQILLEMSGANYEGRAIPFADWGTVKPTTPTGVLPYAVMPDDTVLAESGAIARCVAAATGRLGEGKDFMTSEQLVGMNSDFQKKFADCPTMFTIKDFDDVKKKAFAEKVKPDTLEFLAKYEPFLKGDKFTESGLTFGEIDLFCKLHCSSTPIPEVITGKLGPFYKRILEEPAVKKILSGESRYGPLQGYMLPVPS